MSAATAQQHDANGEGIGLEFLQDMQEAIRAAKNLDPHYAPDDPWPEAHDLDDALPDDVAKPYPLECFPAKAQGAIEEVSDFVKAPLSMIGSCALSTLSVAGQAYIDVERAEGLRGPVSLYCLTVAPSGERKSTVDGVFREPIERFHRQHEEENKAALARFEDAHAAWERKRLGLLRAIEDDAAGKRKSAAQQAPGTGMSFAPLTYEQQLAEHRRNEPCRPRVPRLLRQDDTPEELARVLAQEYPCAVVISSEAGIIFGSHAMNSDSIMRSLTRLNVFWDGGVLRIGRKTEANARDRFIVVRDARVTLGLQVQREALDAFIQQSKGLARGTGFLARFLVTEPRSTRGVRLFTDPPHGWPRLRAFNDRISQLMATPPQITESGGLVPQLMALSPDAKAMWIRFHDHIEERLKVGGEFRDVSDIASKTADNAVRLAALFTLFEHGAQSSIDAPTMQAAGRVAEWHLTEARRLLGTLTIRKSPAELVDAWLLDYCRTNRVESVPVVNVMQGIAPSILRRKAALAPPVADLTVSRRARIVRIENVKHIQVNPALL